LMKFFYFHRFLMIFHELYGFYPLFNVLI
jgi:hypothetical protein